MGVDGSNLFAIPLNNQYYYLGNKKSLAVGFNLKAGGAIGHLLYHGTELLDDTDYGRYLQASLYDGNDVYPINQKHPYSIWGWNPIQAGSKTGVGAEVLEAYASDTEVLIRALGKEWGKANVDSDVVYETTALLHDRYIELYIRANHFGDDYHATSLQEFPAVFFAPTLTYRAYYDGPAPFTGAAFTMARQLLPCFTPGTALNPTEPWLGLFTQNGFGLTVVAPPQDIPFLAWFQCFPSRGGYTSPISQFDIPPNSSREVKIFLIPGDVTSNRALVYKLVPH